MIELFTPQQTGERLALDLGAITPFLYGFNPREGIYDIIDYISGQRFHPDWTRVGGLMQDLPDTAVFQRMVKKWISTDLNKALDDVEDGGETRSKKKPRKDEGEDGRKTRRKKSS